MTWRSVAVYWVLALVVCAQLLVSLRARSAPVVAASPQVAPIVATEPAAVDALQARRGDATLEFRKLDGRWRVASPAGVAVSSDLVAAFVDTLATIPPVEVLPATQGEKLASFGLDPPQAVVSMAVGATAVATIEFGERNPTRTAVYARRADQGRLYLLGLNAQYYLELIYEQAAVAADGDGQAAVSADGLADVAADTRLGESAGAPAASLARSAASAARASTPGGGHAGVR